MAAARWAPYAMLLAQNHNMQCGSKAKPVSPDELNPYRQKQQKRTIGEDVWIPWEAVAARLERCGFAR